MSHTDGKQLHMCFFCCTEANNDVASGQHYFISMAPITNEMLRNSGKKIGQRAQSLSRHRISR